MKIEIPGMTVKTDIKRIAFNKDHVDLYFVDGTTQTYCSEIMYSTISDENEIIEIIACRGEIEIFRDKKER